MTSTSYSKALSHEAIETWSIDRLALWMLANRFPNGRTGDGVSRHNFLRASSWVNDHGSPPVSSLLALAEAFDWLQAHGLIAESPADLGGYSGVCFFRTRLGDRTVEAEDPARFVSAQAQLALELHPMLDSVVRSLFLSHEYESAVTAAMRAVEIRVRELANLPAESVGVGLMRAAFRSDPPGPLADEEAPVAERQAVMELFSGAIGAYRNPTAHRKVAFESPAEVVRILMQADQLMSFLDAAAGRGAD